MNALPKSQNLRFTEKAIQLARRAVSRYPSKFPKHRYTLPFPTNERSYQQNLNNVYYGTVDWPAQVARDLLNGEANYIDQAPSQSDVPVYRAPQSHIFLL